MPPNPSELVGSEKFVELIKELKRNYRYIILDTPPVGLVADAFQVAPHVEAMLYGSVQLHSEGGVVECRRSQEQWSDENVSIMLNDLRKELAMAMATATATATVTATVTAISKRTTRPQG